LLCAEAEKPVFTGLFEAGVGLPLHDAEIVVQIARGTGENLNHGWAQMNTDSPECFFHPGKSVPRCGIRG